MSLGFGNRLYTSASWTPRLASYPKARLADYFATMVRAFYLHGQHHARFIGSTAMGFNTRNAAYEQASNERAIVDNDFSLFHTGRSTIKRWTSHVRAFVLFASIYEHPVDVFFSLSVDNESDPPDVTELGPIVIEPSFVTVPTPQRPLRLQGIGVNPFTAGANLQFQTIDVELDSVTKEQPGRCQTRVGGYALHHGQSGMRGLVPIYAAVYAEMRYGNG